jgi:hypothetical protein
MTHTASLLSAGEILTAFDGSGKSAARLAAKVVIS